MACDEAGTQRYAGKVGTGYHEGMLEPSALRLRTASRQGQRRYPPQTKRGPGISRRRLGQYSFETSNEDKVFFPDTGLTKGALIEYYERIAERILPHLRDRPLVVQRFPDGIDEEGFYQKQAAAYLPDWITTIEVDLKTTGGCQKLVVCGKQATLVYLIDQGCVTLHPWLSSTDRIQHPDSLVIDLDPPDSGFDEARRDYTVENVLGRIHGRDDLWQGLRRRARALGPARERLARLLDE